MKKITEMNLDNKKVILRCDYNVPVKDGTITDDSRITKSLRTIEYLLSKNCQVIILSHFGRIKEESDKSKYDLLIVAKKLNELLDGKVTFFTECYGEDLRNKLKEINSKVILIQNTRYMDLKDKWESSNNLELAKYWASLGDIYINDAFGASHRCHASTAGIKAYLESGIGFLIMDELDNLNSLINITKRPFTIFMGGAKVEDKLPIIKKLLAKCDYLLLGGGILNSFLKANGEDIMDSLCTSNEDILNEIKYLLTSYQHKIIMSKDYIISDNKILDIKIDSYKEYIDKSKLFFLNGTPGMFENVEFSNGTKDLLEYLKNSNIDVIVGGGDTVNALKKFGYEGSFKFVSSGGGASLEYIADESLKALEWMNK